MARTLDFLINKNVDYVIDILSSNLNVNSSTLWDKFLKYDFSGTEYFDKVFMEMVGVSIWEIKEINWYSLCDAYDLCGGKYPSQK
jgi:hypothetical protein